MIKIKCDKCGKLSNTTILKSNSSFISSVANLKGLSPSHVGDNSFGQKPILCYLLIQKKACCQKELLAQPIAKDKLLDLLIDILDNPRLNEFMEVNEIFKINVDF